MSDEQNIDTSDLATDPNVDLNDPDTWGEPSEEYTDEGGWFDTGNGTSQKFNDDGSITYKEGSEVYTLNPNGTYTTTSGGQSYTYDPEQNGFVDSAGKLIVGGVNSSVVGKSMADKILANIAANPIASALTAGAGIKALYDQFNKQGGYNKPVPKLDMTRAQVPYAQDPNRRPGEAGRDYFTNPSYTYQDKPEDLAAAQEAANARARTILAAAPKYAAPATQQAAPSVALWNQSQLARAPAAASAGLPAIPTAEQLNEQGGIRMAQGGVADAGRYLQGKTDGMADEIKTSIDGEQPALLSHGEFVIPADVVSHLGNGNSEAGAEKLYGMMARIRKARTGTEEQGKEINADKFLSAASGGLAAAYAGGGEVQRFQTGGVPLDTSRTSTLSPWVGDYVTNALGQGAAMAQAPYQAYQGPLTAGASDLQQQAFAGASNMANTGYQPGQFIGGFGTQQAQQYMNPYLQASLDPQLKELTRQSDIARLGDAARMTQAGAFGGSRQAIMESEGRRNLLDKQQDVLASGYKSAYDTGLGQFNKEREAEEASRQFSANFGMKSLQGLADMGAVQRGITSEGLNADREQFEEQRDFAYKMPQYQLGLLSGLPIGANTTSVNQDAISKMHSDISGLASLYETLAGLGQEKKTTTTTG
jgi:hypothetical protein